MLTKESAEFRSEFDSIAQKKVPRPQLKAWSRHFRFVSAPSAIHDRKAIFLFLFLLLSQSEVYCYFTILRALPFFILTMFIPFARVCTFLPSMV